MRLKYKFYYKENGVLKIQFFNILKDIKVFLEKNPFIPIQINKFSGGFYKKIKVWSVI